MTTNSTLNRRPKRLSSLAALPTMPARVRYRAREASSYEASGAFLRLRRLLFLVVVLTAYMLRLWRVIYIQNGTVLGKFHAVPLSCNLLNAGVAGKQ